MPLTTEVGNRMIGAAQAKARELGIAVSTAIYDAEGRLYAFSRMDGTPWISVEVSQAKAFTGALLGRDGADLQKMDSNMLLSLADIQRRGLFATPSVTVVREDGKVVAGVGCSGGTDPQDGECGAAARDAFSS